MQARPRPQRRACFIPCPRTWWCACRPVPQRACPQSGAAAMQQDAWRPSRSRRACLPLTPLRWRRRRVCWHMSRPRPTWRQRRAPARRGARSSPTPAAAGTASSAWRRAPRPTTCPACCAGPRAACRAWRSWTCAPRGSCSPATWPPSRPPRPRSRCARERPCAEARRPRPSGAPLFRLRALPASSHVPVAPGKACVVALSPAACAARARRLGAAAAHALPAAWSRWLGPQPVARVGAREWRTQPQVAAAGPAGHALLQAVPATLRNREHGLLTTPTCPEIPTKQSNGPMLPSGSRRRRCQGCRCQQCARAPSAGRRRRAPSLKGGLPALSAPSCGRGAASERAHVLGRT